MPEMSAGKGAAFLLALLSIILLSTNSAAVVLTAGSFDPILFSIGATVVSLVAFGPGLLSPAGRTITRSVMRLPAFRVAILLKAVNDLAFYFVMISTQQIEAAVIVYLYPIFNLLLGCVILEAKYKRPGPAEWGLVVLSFLSILLLTPLYGLADLSLWGFLTALLSAVASVYVVLLQAASDKAGLSQRNERIAIGALFAGSLGVHLVVLGAAAAVGLWTWPGGSLQSGGGLFWPLVGMVWVGIVVNVLSEGLWLRASRIYGMVSLKSLFYLSPVLTAVYFAALDIDDLSRVVVFCLAGVVASNYLLHDQEIDDPSLIAFLFGLVGTATFFKLVAVDPIEPPIPMTQDTYQSYITFTVVIVGFLLSRALAVAQGNSDRLLNLAWRVLPTMSKRGATDVDCETAFSRLAARPDILLWPNEHRTDRAGRALEQVLGTSDVAPAYLAFLNGRQTGVSRPELLLTSLLCSVAVFATVSQALQAERGYFLASFSTGILLFIPVLIREYTGLTAARQYAGVVVRRTLAVSRMTEGAPPPAQGLFRQAAQMRTLLFVAISVVVAAATWAMLYELG